MRFRRGLTLCVLECSQASRAGRLHHPVCRYRDGCIKHGVYPWEYWCVSDLWRLVDQNSNQLLTRDVVSTNIRRFVHFAECVENAKGEEGEPAAFNFSGEPALYALWAGIQAVA